MQYPEPLSTMLREFDINSYLSTQPPILISQIQKHTVPYIVCKPFLRKSTIAEHPKLIGFFTNAYRSRYEPNVLDDGIFSLSFIITPFGVLSRSYPFDPTDTYVYELPENIRNEMMLANMFINELNDAVMRYNDNVPQHKIQDILDIIDNIVAMQKTDYLKMTVTRTNITPLMIVSQHGLESIFLKLLNYYTDDEINFEAVYGDTAKNVMQKQMKKKLTISGLIYAMENKNISLGDWDYKDIASYIGGRKVAKRQRKTRKTKKTRRKQ